MTTEPTADRGAFSKIDLRGKCHEYSKAAVATDPSLRLVRGWYIDPTWGRQEHWWTERPDGSIYDPTSAQFPMGGVREWYEEFAGIFPCEECGMDFAEGKGYDRCCSVQCYGRMVGVYVPASASSDYPAVGGVE